MRNRLLTIVNFLLVIICGGCTWFLATQEYQRDPELDQAKLLIEGKMESETVVRPNPSSTVINPTPKDDLDNLDKGMFHPIWTPTPTPAPTPTPTPPPPDLGTAVQVWKIMSMDGDKVEILDPHGNSDQGETFEMTVGGPTRQAADKDHQMVDVSLAGIDMENGKVIFSYLDQKFEKSMME